MVMVWISTVIGLVVLVLKMHITIGRVGLGIPELGMILILKKLNL